MVTERVRDYELVMVLNPEADEEQVNTLRERVRQFVTSRGGSISGEETWGLRRLAYPVKQFQEGNYTLTQFTLKTKDILELERSLKLSGDVLRHLVTQVEAKSK